MPCIIFPEIVDSFMAPRTDVVAWSTAGRVLVRAHLEIWKASYDMLIDKGVISREDLHQMLAKVEKDAMNRRTREAPALTGMVEVLQKMTGALPSRPDA